MYVQASRLKIAALPTGSFELVSYLYTLFLVSVEWCSRWETALNLVRSVVRD